MRDGAVGGHAHLEVAHVDAWYRDATAHGVPTSLPSADQPRGVRDVRFRDPDGNQLAVEMRQGA
jgi:catechol 2,3-dioxygenase-like lactoylglutathione lyase family enzyme